MNDKKKDIINDCETLELSIMGRGIEVEKMQKRLNCAARASHSQLSLSWVYQYPAEIFGHVEGSVAVIYKNKVLIDGLMPTEEIEKILLKLRKNT
ncbi:MAG: hypothetical protein ACWA5R_04755 [bacterium]